MPRIDVGDLSSVTRAGLSAFWEDIKNEANGAGGSFTTTITTDEHILDITMNHRDLYITELSSRSTGITVPRPPCVLDADQQRYNWAAVATARLAYNAFKTTLRELGENSEKLRQNAVHLSRLAFLTSEAARFQIVRDTILFLFRNKDTDIGMNLFQPILTNWDAMKRHCGRAVYLSKADSDDYISRTVFTGPGRGYYADIKELIYNAQ